MASFPLPAQCPCFLQCDFTLPPLPPCPLIFGSTVKLALGVGTSAHSMQAVHGCTAWKSQVRHSRGWGSVSSFATRVSLQPPSERPTSLTSESIICYSESKWEISLPSLAQDFRTGLDPIMQVWPMFSRFGTTLGGMLAPCLTYTWCLNENSLRKRLARSRSCGVESKCWQLFFCERPDSKYFKLCRACSPSQLLGSAPQTKSSRREWISEWVWVCSNCFIFTNR